MSSTQQTGGGADAWLLTDGHAGNVRQAAALAGALGLGASAPALVPRAPWRWLAPRRLPGAAQAFGEGFAAALRQPPALAIGCGRQGALATRLLREQGARVVQILDPRLDPRHWDVVVAPEHDGLRGANVLTLLGSLNPVDEAWLADAAHRFPALMDLPRPRTVLLVGGPTRHAPWRDDRLRHLLGVLAGRVRSEGGSLLATVSRRTPATARALLHRHLQGLPGLLWDGSGVNPYAGMLACADRIVCTPDSANMLSEACATAAPVHVADAGVAGGRIGSLVRALQARGRIREAGGDLEPFAAEPLRETARIATQLRQMLTS
ncbi:mitochondrial fission ELM1 family protein [Pseudoxanthomonas sp. 10H]|uniref:mitochondrial fission ELM1 family protein n=1 Tax=Pseudoxanthomonas sp. 10H TaxID=3242729 RepID=UPI003556DC7E